MLSLFDEINPLFKELEALFSGSVPTIYNSTMTLFYKRHPNPICSSRSLSHSGLQQRTKKTVGFLSNPLGKCFLLTLYSCHHQFKTQLSSVHIYCNYSFVLIVICSGWL
uniref:Uncharacterized protein n=1 Tax=Lepeophtheirus salmonis TaxID=72036 RepID=A0A0K2UVP7_LEPSM